MTRSKIFLGITTALLAVAGVTAAKHYGPTIQRFYVTIGGNYCKAQNSICTSGGTKQCVVTVSDGLGGLVQRNIYTKGTEGAFPSGVKCTSLLKYVNAEH